MAQKEKITKLVLKEFDKDLNAYKILHPQTSGDMVIGKVSDSDKLDGKSAKDFMPSTTEKYMQVIDDIGNTKGVLASQMVLSDNIEDTNKLLEHECSLWVKGNVYVNNGKEIATTADLDKTKNELLSGMSEMTVKQSVSSYKLKNPVNINNVFFDGTADINIPFYQVSDVPPNNNRLLWINSTNSKMYYFYNNEWKQIKM